MKFFSVVLPVRNGGEYIKDCVNSILAQTYPHFNLIILDNCSTDGTLDWLNSLQNKKIIIYPSDISLTIEQNWARVTTIEKMEFMTLIGHDDLLYPNFLETINNLINEHPTAGLYTTHFDFIDSKSLLIRPSMQMPAKMTAASIVENFFQSRLDMMGTGYVMRSVDYDAIGGIAAYPSLLFADFELWIRLIGNTYEAISDKDCFAFRKHASTTTTSKDNVMLAACKRFIDFLGSYKKNNEAVSKAVDNYLGHFLQVNAISMAHRLLRTPIELRNGLTVVSVIDKFRQWAAEMHVSQDYHPEKEFRYKVAKLIDGNTISRNLFLQFKKIYTKPVINKN